jgi:hypothetical protein
MTLDYIMEERERELAGEAIMVRHGASGRAVLLDRVKKYNPRRAGHSLSTPSVRFRSRRSTV